ncbi:hypothetical protein M569_09255 [Genlisea aurea]|uniref:Uncharacterized protein n=1 Tax=Genlisea aurea TaxID=192259 RepID=S8DZP8_9LAMI|nr:hypothetical protein M569_09255 [Genlisea aurea]
MAGLGFFLCFLGWMNLCDGTETTGLFPGVFAYGDSVVDQGNNNGIITLAKANFEPYGKDFAGGIPTGRFSNGKTPPDLIAEELNVKYAVPAFLDPNLTSGDLLTGVSFASGGCGFDPMTSRLASAIPLSTQLKFLKQYKRKAIAMVGSRRADTIVNDSLHLVVVGTDDLVNTYFTLGALRLRYNVSEYTDYIASRASDFVRELHETGARRIALFGVPPVGCLPSQRTLAGGPERQCNDEYNEAARLLNSKLSNVVDSRASSPATKTHDRGCCGTGLIEVTPLCNVYSETCGDDSEYVFWDSYHPTEMAYRIIVRQLLRRYVRRFF